MASRAAASRRFTRTFGAVNIGSFRISAMIMGETESGELQVLGSGHRARTCDGACARPGGGASSAGRGSSASPGDGSCACRRAADPG